MKISKKIVSVTVLLLTILFVISCKKDPAFTAPEPPNITLERLVPSYYPKPFYKNDKNLLTKEGIELGRKLFYDPMLSANNTMSCASCHKQEYAFSDAGVAISPGETGALGTRNSPPIFNMAWNKTYMWDGGITHLEIMPFAPITAPHEMNQNMKSLLIEFESNTDYQKDFIDAFGEDGFSELNFYYALAQFMSAMVSTNSKYDQVVQGKASFNQEESNGYTLFKNKCNHCHTEPLFMNNGFANNGLDFVSVDSGRGRVTGLALDMGKFKIPSLRNITLTAPYMHDGRIGSLEDVIEHYSSQIVSNPNLHPSLQGGLKLSAQEKESILAFLKTLTDQQFITNKNLSNPF